MTVVLDVDGTLVDTNYQHATAWHRALRDHGYAQLWEIHRHIGMGGDDEALAADSALEGTDSSEWLPESLSQRICTDSGRLSAFRALLASSA